MAAVNIGEIWMLQMDNEFRRVRVVGPAGKSGWWRCVDLATDIYVLARESCFAEREDGRRSISSRQHPPRWPK